MRMYSQFLPIQLSGYNNNYINKEWYRGWVVCLSSLAENQFSETKGFLFYAERKATIFDDELQKVQAQLLYAP